MRKLTLIFTFLLVGSLGKAQNAIPNSGFENWFSINIFENPQGWNTSNQFAFLLTNKGNVSKETSGVPSGNNAVKLETVSGSGSTFPGIMALGDVTLGLNIKKSIPYTATPDSFTFYYKTDLKAGDTASVYMIFKKGSQPIAFKIFNFYQNQSTYKRFSAALNLPLAPDSLFLGFISSSRTFPKTGSKFYVDNIKFIGSSTDTVVNEDFERWDATALEEPTSWSTSNIFHIVESGTQSVFKSSDSHSGNYAMLLENKYSSLIMDTIAFATTGYLDPQTEELEGGFPVDSTPEKLTGYYKYQPVNNDSALIGAWLFRNTSGTKDTLAEVYVKLGPASSYTKFELDFPPNILQPDSANIAILAGDIDFKPQLGSKLWVDELSLIYSKCNVTTSNIMGPKSPLEAEIDTYSVDLTSGSSYNWSVTNGTIMSGGMSNEIVVKWLNAGPGTVNVVETTKDNCVGDTVNLNVNVQCNVQTGNITGLTSVLVNDTKTYSVSGSTNSTFEWFVTKGSQVNGGNSDQIDVKWTTKGGGKVQVVETKNNGCVGDTVTLQVNIGCDVQTGNITGPTKVTVNDTETYSVTGSANSTFSWTITGGTQINGSNSDQIDVKWTTAGQGKVEVVETEDNGCVGNSVTLNVTVDNTTSISETPSSSDFKIYPNPASSNFTLSILDSKYFNVQFTVTDVTGKIIFIKDNISQSRYNISTENWKPGIYIYEVKIDDNISRGQIVIQ